MDILKRELYIVVHGQTGKFRLKKWIVILGILLCIGYRSGWGGVVAAIAVSFPVGICIHFYFRHKTRGWTRPWGPMKTVIKTPYD